MWIVEINVLGRRFTHRVNERPDAFRLAPHVTQWRPWKQRPESRAAA